MQFVLSGRNKICRKGGIVEFFYREIFIDLLTLVRGDCISWYLFDHSFRMRRSIAIKREYPTSRTLAEYTQDKWRKWIGDSLRLDIPWKSVASVSFLSEVCIGVLVSSATFIRTREPFVAMRNDNLWVTSYDMQAWKWMDWLFLLQIMINTFYFNRLATCKSITCYCNFSYCVDILTTRSATVELVGHFTKLLLYEDTFILIIAFTIKKHY